MTKVRSKKQKPTGQQQSKKSAPSRAPRRPVKNAQLTGAEAAEERRVRDCVARYAVARLMPFRAQNLNPCVPAANANPSFKYTTRSFNAVNLTLAAGDGIAFLYSPSAASDGPCLFYVNTGVLLSDTLGTAATAATTITSIGSPFVATAFGAGALEQRLVGCSMRFRPSGAMLYRAGTAFGYFSPDSTGVLPAATTLGSVNGLYNARHKNMPEGRGEIAVVYDTDDFLANQTWFTAARWRNGSVPAAGVGSSAVLFIPADNIGVVQGTIESIEHWEVRGTTVAPFASPNEAAPEMAAKVSEAASELFATMGPEMPSEEGIFDKSGKVVRKHLPDLLARLVESMLRRHTSSVGAEPLFLMRGEL